MASAARILRSLFLTKRRSGSVPWRRASSTEVGSPGVSYHHQLGEQPLLYRTIGNSLQGAAHRWPERFWIKDCERGENFTFPQVLEQADRLAAGLVQIGLRPGDRLGICGTNSARWIITMMAAARAGLVMVAINPVYTQRELEYCLKKVGVRCLVMPRRFKKQEYYNMMVALVPELKTTSPEELHSHNLPDLKSLVILDDEKLPGTFTFSEIMLMATPASIQGIAHLQESIQPDDGCNIQFTSGTTGKPKAALLSHFNYVNNSFLVGKRNELSEKHHTICTQVPLFHAYGLVIVTLASLQHGATMVLPSTGYNPEETIKASIREKCTILTGTPTMYVDLLTKKQEMGVTLQSSELAITGGSPCSPQLFNRIKSSLGVSKVKSVFGMTEITAVCFQSLFEETEEQVTQTVGHVQEHTEVQVIDSNGKVVPFGVPGELCVRGYCNMLGYWNDIAKTEEMIGPDNWLRTGDQFVLQEDGYGRVVGRLKDMIIRGGENVFPKEIEDFLTTHPDIVEAQVFGVKDDRLGEEICACVKLAGEVTLNISQLKMFCQGNISPFKIPRLLRIVEDFPKTASGKIQKFELKKMVETGKL